MNKSHCDLVSLKELLIVKDIVGFNFFKFIYDYMWHFVYFYPIWLCLGRRNFWFLINHYSHGNIPQMLFKLLLLK